jgi:hypothetical protein
VSGSYPGAGLFLISGRRTVCSPCRRYEPLLSVELAGSLQCITGRYVRRRRRCLCLLLVKVGGSPFVITALPPGRVSHAGVPASGLVSAVMAGWRRSSSRQRPRFGPMLPAGRPSPALIWAYDRGRVLGEQGDQLLAAGRQVRERLAQGLVPLLALWNPSALQHSASQHSASQHYAHPVAGHFRPARPVTVFGRFPQVSD